MTDGNSVGIRPLPAAAVQKLPRIYHNRKKIKLCLKITDLVQDKRPPRRAAAEYTAAARDSVQDP